MCSFIYSSSGSLSGDCNERLVLRGPDSTSHVEINGHAFVHNHLSIFSKEHEQPYVDNEREIVLMFNGEIYNTPPTLSEGQFILETYKESGIAGFASLDGEFAILIADFSEQALFLVTDPFATKPIFYSRSRGLWASSFSSSLVNCGVQPQTISKVPANSAVCLSMVDRCLIEQRELVKWHLAQTATSFDGWTEAFQLSVRKRFMHKGSDEGIFLGVSSGYDSGAIHCDLLRAQAPFVGVSILGKENHEILEARSAISDSAGCSHVLVSHEDARAVAPQLADSYQTNLENFRYQIFSECRNHSDEAGCIASDKAAIALGVVCGIAKANGARINLSGSGSDEIISDYGYNGTPIYGHSNFGGLWPSDLASIFPWASFYGSTQEAYIAKDEFVGSVFGVETRYPFLDKNVVQSFLSLQPRLKNLEYKAPLANFLNEHNYPYAREKKGFSPWA